MRYLIGALALAALFAALAGCRSAKAAGEALDGEWTLQSPILGTGYAKFENGKYEQRMPFGNDKDKVVLVTHGTFILSTMHLTMQPLDFNIEGNSSAISLSLAKSMNKLETLDFGITWDGPDLAYLKLEGSNGNGSASMVIALFRNGAKPDPKKISFSFEMHTSGGGGWQVLPANNDHNVQIMTPVRPTPQATYEQAPQAPAQQNTQSQPAEQNTQQPQTTPAEQNPPTTTPEQTPPQQNPPQQPPPQQMPPEQTPPQPDPNQPPPSTTGGGGWR